jgi:hypothetical protein
VIVEGIMYDSTTDLTNNPISAKEIQDIYGRRDFDIVLMESLSAKRIISPLTISVIY